MSRKEAANPFGSLYIEYEVDCTKINLLNVRKRTSKSIDALLVIYETNAAYAIPV